MSKQEFLKRLEELLKDINPVEKNDVINYYRDYFEDSQLEESEVIKELGSPESIAKSILEELADKELVVYDATRENTTGKSSESATESTAKNIAGQNQNYYDEQNSNTGQSNNDDKHKNDVWLVIAIVLACFVGVPMAIPLFCGVFGVCIGIISVFFGLLVAVAACSAAFGAAAVICFVVACVRVFSAPIASVVLLGVACMCLGLCFLSTLATIKMCTVVIPGFIKGITYLVKLPMKKKGVA